MTLAYYRVTAILAAETPLHLGSGRRTGVIKHTYPYIPGSVLRGSTGSVVLKASCKLDRPLVNHEECPHFEDCLYADLFGEEWGKASKVFFRYAYPLHLKCGGVYQPAPKTTYVCKNRQCQRDYDVMVPPEKCQCGKEVKPWTGYRCQRCGDLDPYPVSMSRLTLTALDRGTSSAAVVRGPSGEASGTLHTIELVERGSQFALEMAVHRDVREHLKAVEAALVRGVPDEALGGGKSRGLGRVRVERLEIGEVTTEQVEKRAGQIDAGSFSVRLLSPLLLDGGLLEPGTLLEGARRAYAWVFHEGKPALPELEPGEKRWTVEQFSGWSLKERRRRRIETAISPGSIFQFRCPKPDETLGRALAALEHYSIGKYKPHGCGQMVVVNNKTG